MTMVYVMLLNSSWVFFWCSGYTCINYHIRKCAQTIWTVPQHCQQLSMACLFFSYDYSCFLIIFTVLTILGNAHRPCKEYTNIVDNGLHHISLFFLIRSLAHVILWWCCWNINMYKQVHRARGEVVCICFEHCENNIRKKIL